MRKSIILRTYGGIGNQLFQFLYGRLLSKKFNIKLKEIHSIKYSHKFPRSKLLKSFLKPNFIEQLFSNLRIPMLISEYLDKKIFYLKFFNNIYIDNYFQEKLPFLIFTKKEIKEVLNEFILELNLNIKKDHGSLVHLRLNDFFKNKEDALNHVLVRLEKCEERSDLISNDIEALKNEKIASVIKKYNHKIVNTSNMNSDELVEFMSYYNTVDTNNSTIAFWAALLSKSKIKMTNKKLSILYDFLFKILWSD